MKALVGYTGFVGSNLCGQTDFDAVYNSKNIEDAYGTAPDLLVYAGVRAEKYLANHEPEKDMDHILQAAENIHRIKPRKMVLISTVDVLKDPVGVDETARIETEGLHPYGYDRYILECKVRELHPDALIVRLPGLFGKNLKKNFLYDYIHRIPFLLTQDKMEELAKKEPDIRPCYALRDNGFYQVRELDGAERRRLKERFIKVGFSALNFTDSRSIYQFYDLNRLWKDIERGLELGISTLHLSTPPISAAELYKYLTGDDFCNLLPGKPAHYDFRTVYDQEFHGSGGYICKAGEALLSIKEFVENAR